MSRIDGASASSRETIVSDLRRVVIVVVGDIDIEWAYDDCPVSDDDRVANASTLLLLPIPKTATDAARTLAAAVRRREFFLLRSLLLIETDIFYLVVGSMREQSQTMMIALAAALEVVMVRISESSTPPAPTQDFWTNRQRPSADRRKQNWYDLYQIYR